MVVRTIKRYPNRLLYDSEVRQFVNSGVLRNYVRHGIEFQITESRSGRDMTVPVLCQVLTDDLSNSRNKKSVIQTLRGFIALRGEVSMEILKKTILASIGVFEITKSKAEEIVDTLIKQGEVAKSKRSEAVLELLDKAEKSGKDFKQKISKDIEKTIEKLKVARKKDLETLTDKVDSLAEQVKALVDKISTND